MHGAKLKNTRKCPTTPSDRLLRVRTGRGEEERAVKSFPLLLKGLFTVCNAKYKGTAWKYCMILALACIRLTTLLKVVTALDTGVRIKLT